MELLVRTEMGTVLGVCGGAGACGGVASLEGGWEYIQGLIVDVMRWGYGIVLGLDVM